MRTPSKTNIPLAALAGAALLMSLSISAIAQDMTELLQILKEKGIITEEEFQRIMDRQKIQRESNREEMKLRASEAAKEEIKAASKDEIKGYFRDGITWESGDKRNSIALRGRIEADYRAFGGDDALGADTWDLRRGYLAAEGKFLDNYEFRVRANFSTLNGPTTTVCTQVGPTSATNPAPTCTQTAAVANANNTHLDEAWLNVNWWKQAQFKFGQFKMPFSLEEMTSDRYTDFQERSMGNVLAPNKERGAQVHGAPTKGVYYALAHSNGGGIAANDTNNVIDNKDLLGRATVNFAELFDQKNAIYHIGASFTDGKIPVSAAPSGRTEARGIQFFTPAAFTGNSVDRTRYGLETAIAYGPVKLQAEFIDAKFTGTSALGVDFDRKIDAYYINLMWLVTGEKYADAYRDGVFVRLRPQSNFSPKGGGWGAWELGLRYSKFDAGDFGVTSTSLVGSGVIPATATNVAEAWTLGIKWIVNPNTRFLLNFIHTDFDNTITVSPAAPGVATTTDDEKAVTFRAQFDF